MFFLLKSVSTGLSVAVGHLELQSTLLILFLIRLSKVVYLPSMYYAEYTMQPLLMYTLLLQRTRALNVSHNTRLQMSKPAPGVQVCE